MGFLGKLIKGVVQTALIPVDVVKDAATLGGALTGQKKPYTAKRVGEILETVEEAADDAGDGDLL